MFSDAKFYEILDICKELLVLVNSYSPPLISTPLSALALSAKYTIIGFGSSITGIAISVRRTNTTAIVC